MRSVGGLPCKKARNGEGLHLGCKKSKTPFSLLYFPWFALSLHP